MAIQFSIARRGLLPHEKEQQGVNQQADLKNLRVVPVCTETVDAVEFQSSSSRLPTVLPKSELLAALDTIQRVMIHELEQGNAVTLPGIGTFRVTVKGDIEVKDGSYHGKNVRVDGLNFRPDRELLKKAQGFEVSQVPLGQTIQTEGTDVEARLVELFASKETITHKDVSFAFGQTLSYSRICSLLSRLVKEGRLVREGKGAQTRYRLA